MSKKVKQRFLILFAFLLVCMPIFNVSNAIAAGEKYCDGKCLETPTSNVSDKEFKNILKDVKKTKEYKEFAKTTVINKLKDKDIVINTTDTDTNGHEVATVGFIIGEKIQSDNLAYVELVYDIEKEVVNTSKLLYGYKKSDNLINISMIVNNEKAFSMDINEKGEIINKDGNVISQDDFYDQAVKEMKKNTISTLGWCEWAVGALCGAGGGAACWALAIALGITTGIGGFSLATVCGLIGALGCTAATIKICG
ncbi:halocin C8 precursor-like protein [Rummeliibacillus pycnus]|uniref:halocin C8 precursor-like protein n=1 Tax=Rummeliibacillus pycnus TaxID=101070 RepID=UPI003D27FFCC